MKKHKATFKLNSFDKIIEVLGILAVGIFVGLPLFSYSILPDVIPRHYNLNGVVDGVSKKEIIWVNPVVGTVLYIGLSFLTRRPHLFQYPVSITERNFRYQYQLAARTIRTLNTLIACMVAYITYATIETGKGDMSGLGGYFAITFGFTICVTIGFYLYKAVKNR